MTELHATTCAYCWETIELALDLSAGDQTYSEDCPVCCQPLVVRVTFALDGNYAVEIAREND